MKSKKYILLAAGAALVVLLGAAAPEDGKGHYRLGGGFIGSGDGMIWNAFQAPLDPAGRTAAIRVNSITYGASLAEVLTKFGADSFTEATGQAEMISRDTAQGVFINYGVKQGNPPQICMIDVFSWTLKFTGPDSFDVSYTLNVYPGPANILGLPTADANGNGFPDIGTKPYLKIPGGVGHAHRVPVPW